MPRGRLAGALDRAALIVDDNPIARAAAVDLFADLGFRVLDCYNGSTALHLLGGDAGIGVLFADVRMPGMTGPELAQAALALRPDLRVVLTSGYVDASTLPSEVPFVPKPWTVEQVVDAIVAQA